MRLAPRSGSCRRKCRCATTGTKSSAWLGIARDITERKRADALRDGQSQILQMIAMSAPLEDVLEHLMHLVESQLTGIYGSVLLLDDDGDPPAARRRAEPGGGLHEGHRRHPHRPQGGVVRHRRLSAGDRHRRRHHARSALGRLSRIGRDAWLSIMLVDADPVASRRGPRHIRDVFDNRARADRGRDASHRRRHPDCRHRDRTQAGRRPHSFHGQPRRAHRASQSRPAQGPSFASACCTRSDTTAG